MRKTFPVCCASTEPPTAKSKALSARPKIFLSRGFSLILAADGRQRVSDGAIGQDRNPSASDKSSTNEYNEQLSRLF